MTIITISWQLGTGGERVGELVGERLGLPVVNRQAVAAIMRALHMRRAAAADLERYVPSWQATMGISLAATFGVPSARAELLRAEKAHATVEDVIREAARQSCVILGRCGFALLSDHPGAYHVRLIAPTDWRVRRVAAKRCLSAAEARKLVAQDDRTRNEFASHFYGARLDDPANFHLVIAAQRYAEHEVVDMIAAGVPARRAEAAPDAATSESII
jgi:cytidylate kinase